MINTLCIEMLAMEGDCREISKQIRDGILDYTQAIQRT